MCEESEHFQRCYSLFRKAGIQNQCHKRSSSARWGCIGEKNKDEQKSKIESFILCKKANHSFTCIPLPNNKLSILASSKLE